MGEGLIIVQWCNREKAVVDIFGRTYYKHLIYKSSEEEIIVIIFLTVLWDI